MDLLTTLQTYLASIRPVSVADYQIRNDRGDLLFSTAGATLAPTAESINALSDRIITGNTFSYDAVEPHMFLCGRPVDSEDRPPLLLLAYGSKRNGISPAKHREQLEDHLNAAVDLAVEKNSSQIEIQELAQQLEHSFEDLYLYDRITSQIKSLQLSERMLHHLMVEIVENMQVDAAFITLPQHPAFNMQIVRPETAWRVKDAESFLANLEELAVPKINTAEENYFILNDSRENLDYLRLAPAPYRFLMVGVRHQEQLLGRLGLVAFNLPEIFRQGELRMLKAMAEQLAIVIANTDLYNNLKQFTINMVSSLVSAIEAKDAYTRGHSERVHRYAMMIANAYGLKDDTLEALNWSAILHDVGKIGVSEEILLKPGKLTDAEFAEIKQHPEKGKRILEPVAHLAPSMGGILHHHERYDGRGYPQGLSGKEIPLAARMIAVADTFDAITSNRPYRDKKTRQEAMAIIESVAGSQLDPNMVALFKKVCPLVDGETREGKRP